MSLILNLSVDGGADFVYNLYELDPSSTLTVPIYVNFTGGIAEFRAQGNNSAGNIQTPIDITSTSPNSEGSLVLGNTALTVYDNTSTPAVVRTIPAGCYWTLTINKATTATEQGQELNYQFDVTLSGLDTRVYYGFLTISNYIPPAS